MESRKTVLVYVDKGENTHNLISLIQQYIIGGNYMEVLAFAGVVLIEFMFVLSVQKICDIFLN